MCFQEYPRAKLNADREPQGGSTGQLVTHDSVRNMVLGDQGVLHMGGLQSGAILINLSPIGPALSTEIEEKISALNERRRHKMGYLDAAILNAEITGGKGGVNATIAVGGDEDAFTGARRLLNLLGRPRHVGGEAAAAQHVKIAQTIKLCSDMIGTVEALYYGHRAGLDLHGLLLLLEAEGYGRTGNMLGALTLTRDFEPIGVTVAGFVEHLAVAIAGIDSL